MSLYGRSKSEVIVTARLQECGRIARDDVVDRIGDFQSGLSAQRGRLAANTPCRRTNPYVLMQ